MRDVVEFDGAETDGPAVLAPLATAQRLLGVPGLVEHLLISNRGDELSGATLSDEVVAWLAPTMAGFGLEIDTEKKDGLERAGRGGQRVHVALHDLRQLLDRRRRPAHLPDLRHARGRALIGSSSGLRARSGRAEDLVQLFLFEGVAYDLIAAVVGVALSVGVAYGMMVVMAQALGAFGVDILYDVAPRSLVIGYALGVLLTLVVVAVSTAARDVLNLSTAVRNLPEPPRRPRADGGSVPPSRWSSPAP